MKNGTREGDLFRKVFLLLLVIAISAAFLATIRSFLMALLLAAILAGLCTPVYRRLCGRLRGRENAAALATVALVVLVVVVPVTSLMGIVAAQAVEVSESVKPWVDEHLTTRAERLKLVANLPVPDSVKEFLLSHQKTLVAKGGELAESAGARLVSLLAAATKGTVAFLVTLFVTLYATFFFLKDGRKALDRILYYMPLEPEDEERMLGRFVSVARATLKGTLVIGIVQGALAGFAFAVAGIEGAAFWGTVMAVLSIIPGLGTALVWVPAVLYLLAIERFVAGGALALWCGAVVGTADNFLRPMLVGKDTRMPDLLILLSTLGGLLLFGAVGIVIGPVIAALFLTTWEIYGVTFRDYLHERVAPAGEGAS